jgi:glycosyltransferase involved in cell wall biosynthesis
MPESNVYVSAILPIFNEKDCISEELGRVSQSLKRCGRPTEIIIIDDASSDGSLQIAEKFIKDNPEVQIRLIALKHNRGSGHARKIGTEAARGEIVVWTDVDMTYPNHLIHELVQAMEMRQLDHIVGARNKEMGTMRLLRTPAKYVLRKLAEFLMQEKIEDLNSGLRAFKRSIAVKYLPRLPRGFSCVTTLTLSFLSDDFTVGYHPIDYHVRVGKSKFHPIRDTAKYFRQIVLMMMSYKPLRIFAPLCGIVFLIGCGLSAYSLWNYHYLPASAVILFFTAFHLMSVGLLADLVVRLNKF